MQKVHRILKKVEFLENVLEMYYFKLRCTNKSDLGEL